MTKLKNNIDGDFNLLTWGNIQKNPLLNKLLNSLTEGVLCLDKTGNCTFINSAALRLIGYKAEECLGQVVHNLIHYKYLDGTPFPRSKCLSYKALTTGQTTPLTEHLYWRKDGTPIYALSSFSPIFQGKEVIGGMTVIVDNSARKEAIENLRQRVWQQEFVTKLGLKALSGIDPQHLMDDAVVILSDVLGVSHAKVLELLPSQKDLIFRAGVGWNKNIIMNKTIIARANSQSGYSLTVKKPVVVEDLNKERRFETPKLLLDHKIISGMSVIIGERRNPYGVLSLHSNKRRIFTREDVNFLQAVANILAMAIERRKDEDDLKDSQERLLLAQEAGHIGTFEWDITTNNVQWSPELEALYGVTPGGLDGKYENWRQTVHPDDIQKVEEDLSTSIKNRSQLNSEFRVIWPDGSIHWILAKGRTFYNESSNTDKIIGVNLDITERKELDRRKDEFISIASHELKTPVASIKGYAQILETYFKGNEKAGYYLSKMNNQIDRISQLINDLLDVSRIHSGKLELQKEKLNVDELVKEVVEDMQQITDQHTILLNFQGDKTPRIVMGDRFRLAQVLINLISNAIKYSPKSKKIEVELQKNNGHTLIKVKDFGIGISKRDLTRIFEPFFQASNKIRQSYSGLGLGLYISSEIIKRHDGRITVESEKGKGTEFAFSLPM